MDMYAFGYALVHAPVKWHLCLEVDEAPFDILLSSLKDHRDDRIQGSIVSVTVCSSNLINFKELPKYLQHSITHFESGISDTDKRVIFTMPSGISTLVHLEHLELNLSKISLKEIQELSSTIYSSHTIESVRLYYTACDSLSDREDERSLHRLVEAALFCPSVKSLFTNIPFKIPITDLLIHMENIRFDMSLHHLSGLPVSLFTCLSCIAEICSVPSMTSFSIINTGSMNIKKVHWRDYYDFLSILNDSLHHNPSMCDLSILTCFRSSHVLPHIIHEDPIIARLNVRRSRSLSDLVHMADSEPVDDDSDSFYGSEDDDDDEVKSTSSCPDMRLLQSLPSIHPLLHKSLKCPLPGHNYTFCKHYPYPNWFLDT